MRANLCGHLDASLLGILHETYRLLGGAVTEVKSGTKFFCDHDIAGLDDILNIICDTAETQASGGFTIVHHAALNQIDIFAVIQDYAIFLLDQAHSITEELGIHNTLTVFREDPDTAPEHTCDIREFLAFHAFREAACLDDIDEANFLRLILDIADHFHIISDRLGIRHCADCSESASGCSSGLGFDICLLRKPRIAEMHMQVDKTWHHITSLCVNLAISLALIGILSNRGDLVIFDQKIRNLIPSIGRI